MTEESQVIAADRAFFAALIAADSAALEAILTADFLLVDLTGSLVSKPDLIGAVKGGQLRFESIEPIEARVRFYGGFAIITGRTQMSGTLGGAPFAFASRYTHFFVETQDRWRLASAQGTPIAPQS